MSRQPPLPPMTKAESERLTAMIALGAIATMEAAEKRGVRPVQRAREEFRRWRRKA